MDIYKSTASPVAPKEEFQLWKKLVAEIFGTALLTAIVIGSGIMGQTVSEDIGVVLLGNTLATGAGLVVLILIFGPISGAHFNPVVTLAFALGRKISFTAGCAYTIAQLAGGALGVGLAHLMFSQPLIQVSQTVREGTGQFLGEIIATFLLIIVILATQRRRPEALAYAVGLTISAGYWFTSSTSFANPAVTIARTVTDTFSGIAPASAPLFVCGQIIGACLAVATCRLLEPSATNSDTVK